MMYYRDLTVQFVDESFARDKGCRAGVSYEVIGAPDTERLYVINDSRSIVPVAMHHLAVDTKNDCCNKAEVAESSNLLELLQQEAQNYSGTDKAAFTRLIKLLRGSDD